MASESSQSSEGYQIINGQSMYRGTVFRTKLNLVLIVPGLTKSFYPKGEREFGHECWLLYRSDKGDSLNAFGALRLKGVK
jgi:hypothetical protein